MSWIGDHQMEAWFILAGALAVLELLSLDLVLIMLAGGAVAGGVTAAVGAPGAVSVVVALVVASMFLFLMRPPIVRRMHAGPELRTGTAALLGRQALVLEPMSSTAPGRVKIGGENWSALPYDEDDRIEAGARVDVVEIKGATAYVLRRPELGPALGSGPGSVPGV